jgi:hypothetical protein
VTIRRAIRLCLWALVALAVSPVARAWDGEIHSVILQGARRLSPSFRARLEGLSFEDVTRAASEGEPIDPICVGHRLVDEPKEAWTRAVRLLEEIRHPRLKRNAHMEALLLGQFFHYVADCAAPRAVLGENAGKAALGAYDVVVFRRRRPLSGSPLDALKARAAEAEWSDPVPEALCAGLRDAVNLTIEAANLLPPLLAPLPPGEEADLPPLFAINKTLRFYRSGRDSRVNASGDPGHEQWSEALMDVIPRRGGTLYAEIALRGVHVIEWTPRTEAGKTTVRTLLFNNQNRCIRRLDVLVGGRLQIRVPAALAPLSLTVVEFPAPPSSPDDVRVWAVRGACAGGTTPRDAATEHSMAFPMGPNWLPDFGGTYRDVRLSIPGTASRSYDVDFDPEVVALELHGLWLTEFVARDAKDSWAFSLEGAAINRKGYVPRPMTFVVEVAGEKVRSERRTFRIEPGAMRELTTFEASVPDTTKRFRNPRFRLVSVKREE